jgi:predicted ATP-grasp superfamily ATP-dependent carboligase
LPGRSDATILVTDAGRGSAIAFLRSLGRRGWRVVAADADPHSAGFRSRYVAVRLIHPDPATHPDDFVEALLDAVRRHGVQLIVPITDEAILPLSAARKRFEGLCTLALPDAEALDAAGDKFATVALAERLGVPTPRTRLVQSAAEALCEAERLGWPIVLKPRRSRLYRERVGIERFEVRYATGPEQLAEAMTSFQGGCGVLLQEYVVGSGQGVEILADAGRPLAAFQHRRLHEMPIHGGRSALRESAPLDPSLYDYAVRLLGALRWTGLGMVEFRVGSGAATLMEVNGRVWGSLPLAVHAGMDFPRRLAELYLLGSPDPDLPADRCYRVGVRARNLDLEIKWLVSLLAGRRLPFPPAPPRREALRGLLGLLDPRIRFDIQSLDDPWPGLADIVHTARSLSARLWRGAGAISRARRRELARSTTAGASSRRGGL